jgi:hypothetical protein
MSVSEAQLNQMVATTISDDSRIKSLQLICEDNVLVVNAGIQLVGSLAITATTRLALEHFELSQERKVITLRRLDNTELGGTGVASSLLARVVKLVVCGLFGIDLGEFSLKNINGLTIDKERITADLAALGVVEAITDAICSKIDLALKNIQINPWLKPIIATLLPAITKRLVAKAVIEDLSISEAGIAGTLRLFGSHDESLFDGLQNK